MRRLAKNSLQSNCSANSALDLAQFLLLLSTQVSLAEFSLYLPQSFHLSLLPLSSLIFLSLFHALCPSCPICYFPAGSVFTLHCSSPSEDPGWVSHPLTICCLKLLRHRPHSRTPLTSMGMLIYTDACSHAHYVYLRREDWKPQMFSCKQAHEGLNLNGAKNKKQKNICIL